MVLGPGTYNPDSYVRSERMDLLRENSESEDLFKPQLKKRPLGQLEKERWKEEKKS